MGEGVQGLLPESFPRVAGIEYLVSWQRPDLREKLGDVVKVCREIPDLEVPDFLQRGDVKTVVSTGTGLSRNRNIALCSADAEICLLADDDMHYSVSQLESVIEAFAGNADADLVAFRYDGDQKLYPDYEFDLQSPPKGWYISSVEIAFRLEKIRALNLYFDTEVGLGAKRYCSGEEELWLYELLQRGVHGIFLPITIGRHRGLSTGVRKASESRVLLAQGYVAGRTRMPWAPLRLAKKAYRVWRSSGRAMIINYWWLLQGWFEGLRFRHNCRRKW